ncbi:flagellar export protein FliJ [Tersicoccus sp. MR15.9]|uniref:flagellar FliJ family protein n=1 Tax=Tersicoccus mangrovi TaxID=3121635 RepID=UPI002FE6C2E5
MSAPFRLAGLLRLRRLNEDAAAARWGSAAAEHRAARSRRDDLYGRAVAGDTTPDSVASLRAIAAARSSTVALLAELDAATMTAEQAERDLRDAWTAARTATAGLEKLEERHDERTAHAELAADQAALDELAVTRHGRGPTP